MTTILVATVVYQIGVVILILGSARLVQPHVPKPRMDWSMRVMQVGLWLLLVGAFVVSALTEFNPDLALWGLLLITPSVCLRVWAMTVMGEQFSYDLRVPDRKVTSGPYKYFRHPAYLGSIGLFTSIGMVWGSKLATWILLGGTIILFGWRAYLEERDFLPKLPTSAQ